MEILLQITERMFMTSSSTVAGRDGDHDFVIVKIIKPDFLNEYQCRLEFISGTNKNFMLVTNDTFLLSSEMTKFGILYLQLVYINTQEEIITKTNIIQLNIGKSINAIDETEPIFADGLAQLADSSFAIVEYIDNELFFKNRNEDIRGQAKISIAGGNDSTVEADRITALENTINSLQTAVSSLQAEATAKWVLLNNVDNRSRNNATNLNSLISRIEALENRIN